MRSPQDWLPFLHQIADAADEIALRYFRRDNLKVERKSDESPVTLADKGIEEAAYSLTQRLHPELGFFGEEQGEQGAQSDIRLIIDPIDGTRNFIRGIPIFGTLLAVEEHEQILAGLVSAAALGSRWYAAVAGGAFRDKTRIHVSTVEAMAEAELFHGDLSGAIEPKPPDSVHQLLTRVRRTRGFGDFYQHLLVAEGCGEISVDFGLQPWDAAPLQIIVTEAGGRATDYDGNSSIYSGDLICSNGPCHDEVLEILKASN